MKPAIRPIETDYAGCRFRSRLEARWARFFDAMTLRWEYEPEGFEGEGERYLPDFWLRDLRVWLEIKPEWPSETEFRKAVLPILATGHPLYIAVGSPNRFSFLPSRTRDGVHWTEEKAEGELIEMLASGDWVRCRGFCECRRCERVGIGPWATEFGEGAECCVTPSPKTPRLMRAYEAARSARFERYPRNMRRALEDGGVL